MPAHFSQRTNWPLSSNTIISTLNQLREQKVSVLDLTESNPTHCRFEYSNKKFLSSLTRPANLDYEPHPQGLLKAREAVRDYYKRKGKDVPPDRIFLTASTSEAYSYLFRLLANPQEEILFPAPSYPLFQFLVDLNDLQMSHYQLQYEEEWSIDFEDLKGRLSPLTRAIVVVNPNNPTGSFIKREELAQLNTICREDNLSIVADEVFTDFTFKKGGQSLVGNDEVLTFVLGGISKTLGLPQMKLAWIVLNGPKDLVKIASERLEVIADTYLSVATPVQNALADWLALRESVQKEIKGRLARNLNFLKKKVKDNTAIQLLSPEGGWYAVLRIPAVKTEEEWILDFLVQDHVFVHPGYFFDFAEEAHLVLSLLPTSEVFEEGVKRVLRRVKTIAKT